MEEDIIDRAVAAGIRTWEGVNSYGKAYPSTFWFASVWLEGYMEAMGLDEVARLRLRNKLNSSIKKF